MTCVHLKQLYQLCHDNDLRLSSTDLVHVVCQQCGKEEVCPSVLMDEYETVHPGEELNDAPDDSAAGDES
jgi:hypothetical protein